MREITDEQEVANLYVKAVGQERETEEPEPSATIWIALVQEPGIDNWCLVTRDALGQTKAFTFSTGREAMGALEEVQELFRTWLEQHAA